MLTQANVWIVENSSGALTPRHREVAKGAVIGRTDTGLGDLGHLARVSPNQRLVHLLASAADLLALDHLEVLGGPGMFDLTQPDIYDLWANRFVECVTCDGTDDWSPAVVIVDGLTAILQAVGKGTDAYGQWYAAFRRLMHELDVPNALVVGHSTLAGNHLMGGVEAQAGPDGLWVYSSDDSDRPSAARRFSVVPRLGGKPMNPTRVVWSEEGRLRLGSGSGPPSPDEPKPREPDPSADEQVMTDLRAVGTEGIMTTDLTGRGAESQYGREALRRLVASGEAVERREGRGKRLWARESAPAGLLRGRDRPGYGLERGDLRSEASDGPGG